MGGMHCMEKKIWSLVSMAGWRLAGYPGGTGRCMEKFALSYLYCTPVGFIVLPDYRHQLDTIQAASL